MEQNFSPRSGNILFTIPAIDGNSKQIQLTIALSVKASEFPDRFHWAKENGFALEYTPDPLSPELISEHVTPFVQSGVPVRFHTRFFDFELGNEVSQKAEEALQTHMNVIDHMAGLGEPVITVHLNLNKQVPFNLKTARENLFKLTTYAKTKGITVCLENLKKGPTSDPNNIFSWAKEAGSMITMDMGHAISSDYVNDGNCTVPDIVDMFAPKLMEAHMYGKEEDRHYPIKDISSMSDSIDHLLGTGCRWWTIELDDYEEALNTRKLLLDYLKQK